MVQGVGGGQKPLQMSITITVIQPVPCLSRQFQVNNAIKKYLGWGGGGGAGVYVSCTEFEYTFYLILDY